MSDRVVNQLFSGQTTPKTFCGMLVEQSDEIENIACVIHWKDGNTTIANTTMKNEDKAWFRWVFDQDFRPEDS